jgi:hypothetical protein
MPPNEIQTQGLSWCVGEMETYKRLRAGCSRWHTESFLGLDTDTDTCPSHGHGHGIWSVSVSVL